MFGLDLQSVLSGIEAPDNTILLILLLIYWVIFASYIEEWFWRLYYWEVLYSDRIFDRLWIALTWGLMYAVIMFTSADIISAVITWVVLSIVGYILSPIIRHEWSWNSMFLCHFGCNGGIAICYFLAQNGMF